MQFLATCMKMKQSTLKRFLRLHGVEGRISRLHRRGDVMSSNRNLRAVRGMRSATSKSSGMSG